MIVSHQLLTIISRAKDSEVFSMYFAQENYDPQSSRLFFNKHESYSRNAKYNSWELLPISKK